MTSISKSFIDLIITNDKRINYCIYNTTKITDHSIVTMRLEEEIKKHDRLILTLEYKKHNNLEFELDLIKRVC